MPLSTAIVAIVLSLLVTIGCLFAFNAYIASLMRETRTVLAEAVSELDHDHNSNDAAKAGQRIATRLLSPSLIIVFIGATHRVTVYHRPQSRLDQLPVVVVRERDDRSAEPADGRGFARFVLGLASICGLQVERAHFGSLDIYVKSNDRAIVSTIQTYVLPFAVALGLVLIASAIIARFLTNQGLRPLLDVTAALERFAEGDFTPQFVASSSQEELGRLARGYNGAVAQVEQAFGERERANAMMRQFIADAGHQLRTPLTVIRGFIDMLADPIAITAQERQRMLRVMAQQTVLMRLLIDNLMLLDRWENAESPSSLEITDLTQLAEDLVTMIGDANHPRTLTFRANDIGISRVDPHEMTYAIMNILDNALKYTAGAIDVNIDVTPSVIILMISDGGPGMPAVIAEHAFDRFFRGERRDIDGSGLGLAIAKKAVERAGGSITLSTSPDHGTIVRIELPRVQATSLADD